MNTRHFDYFLTIAATGNLSRAASHLGVSQPVLSRYLSGLEDRLGITLFEYDGRAYNLTQAGKIYRNGVMRMKELQTQLIRSLDTLHGKETRTLKIGMSPYRGGRELAAFYPDLLSRYPTLDVSLTEGNTAELLDMLYEGALSSIINLYDPELMPKTRIASLIRSELLLVLPSYHPLCAGISTDSKHPATISAEQLASLNDVLFVCLDTGSIVGQVIEKVCRHYQFSPQILLRTGNSIAVSSLIATGSYAGFQLENTIRSASDICCFRLPEPVFLYSGMIFSEDHEPDEIERYLYCLEYMQAAKDTPDLLYTNELGLQILNSVNEYSQGGI